MADAGDLEKLPVEIRKQIYKFLLVETRKIGIMRYGKAVESRSARMDNHHNVQHRGKVYDTHKREWVAAPPCVISLLYVNRRISQEAKEILYGFNQFEFEHAGALESFLANIGDSIAHVRHVAIIGHGLLYSYRWDEMDRSLARLAKAKALRTLEISHGALCKSAYQTMRRPVEPRTLFQHFRPLLRVLEAEYRKQHLNVSAADVIKISLPPCQGQNGNTSDHTSYHRYDIERSIPVTKRSRTGNAFATIQCLCHCDKAEDKNRQFVEELKQEIAEHFEPVMNGKRRRRLDRKR